MDLKGRCAIMRKLLAVLLALGMLLTCAFAEVYTTGNVNLRKGPGLNYDTMGSVPEGTELEYLGAVSTDERGVDWYMVEYKGKTAWISSKYSELRGEQIWKLDANDPHADAVELSGYFMQDLSWSANEAGLTEFHVVNSEAPNQYYNDSAVLGGYDRVEYIGLTGRDYCVFGVTLGMEVEEARQVMTQAGLVLYDDYGDALVFLHPSNEYSCDWVGDYDSSINLYCVDGVVVELDWSAYTG